MCTDATRVPLRQSVFWHWATRCQCVEWVTNQTASRTFMVML